MLFPTYKPKFLIGKSSRDIKCFVSLKFSTYYERVIKSGKSVIVSHVKADNFGVIITLDHPVIEILSCEGDWPFALQIQEFKEIVSEFLTIKYVPTEPVIIE